MTRRLAVAICTTVLVNGLILAVLVWARPTTPTSKCPSPTVRTLRPELIAPPEPAQPPAPDPVATTAGNQSAPSPSRSSPPPVDLTPVPPAPATTTADLSPLAPLAPDALRPDPTKLSLPAPTADPVADEAEPTPSTTPAVLLKPIDPSRFYPFGLRRRGVTGTTRLRVRVDADGRAAIAKVLATTPGFEAAARELVAATVFIPATRHEKPVATERELTIRWRLEE